MMETQNYWEDNSAHSMQVKYESLDGRSCKDELYRMGLGTGYCEGNLNFATASEDDEVYTKKKVSRQDPMSHRIIEKRRRDRMNNCLADLSRLIPAEYLKKGRGRVEKTEIIEMAIRHMKYLQGLRQDLKHHTPVSSVHTVHAEDSVDSVSHQMPMGTTAAEHYRLGYQECLSETLHFLVEVEGFYARDTMCAQLINHLQQHCDKILAKSDRLGNPHPMDMPTTNGSACGGDGSFSHVNGGIPSMCLNNNNNNNNNNVTSNGVGLLNNVSSVNVNGNSNHHQQQHTIMHNNNNNSSDRCSSSGVSSMDSNESRPQRPLIPPPTLVSDDSNHSSHSHSSNSMQMSSNGNHQQEQRPPANYKFKNLIKQRFSADQRIKTSASPPPSCSSDASPRHSQSHGNQQGVPIFALHDNGGFYVPLTVEASLLRPQMGYSSPDSSSEMVLHPVTISVNFNHSTPPGLSYQSPTHQIH